MQRQGISRFSRTRVKTSPVVNVQTIWLVKELAMKGSVAFFLEYEICNNQSCEGISMLSSLISKDRKNTGFVMMLPIQKFVNESSQ